MTLGAAAAVALLLVLGCMAAYRWGYARATEAAHRAILAEHRASHTQRQDGRSYHPAERYPR